MSNRQITNTTEPFVSFANSELRGFNRLFVKVIESVSGRRHLKKIYNQYITKNPTAETVWSDIIEMLNIDVRVTNVQGSQIPKTGGLLIVANHPLGILDGIALCSQISKIRSDFRIVAHTLLAFSSLTQKHILPISFEEETEAVRSNIETRKKAVKMLQDGGVVFIFPAGAISLAPKVFDKAVDEGWKGFTTKLAMVENVKILPVYFHEQNSRLFQVCRRASVTLGYSLMFREVRLRMNKSLNMTYQPLISFDESNPVSRKDVLDVLRKEVYAGTKLK